MELFYINFSIQVLFSSWQSLYILSGIGKIEWFTWYRVG